MLRALLLTTNIILISGCTYLGSKSALSINENDAWKTEYEKYVFRGSELFISIEEIVITEHGSALGPIIPIIPLNHDRSFESKRLELHATVTGFPNPNNYSPNIAEFEAYSSGNKLSLASKEALLVGNTTKNNKEGKLWVQYSFTFAYKAELGQLSNLSLNFSLPMFKEKIPTLHLTRREMSDNEFILSPGP
jgi:hypothetical protein